MVYFVERPHKHADRQNPSKRKCKTLDILPNVLYFVKRPRNYGDRQNPSNRKCKTLDILQKKWYIWTPITMDIIYRYVCVSKSGWIFFFLGEGGGGGGGLWTSQNGVVSCHFKIDVNKRYPHCYILSYAQCFVYQYSTFILSMYIRRHLTCNVFVLNEMCGNINSYGKLGCRCWRKMTHYASNVALGCVFALVGRIKNPLICQNKYQVVVIM